MMIQVHAWCLYTILSTYIHIARSASCRPFNHVYPTPRNVSAQAITSASQSLGTFITQLLQNETVQTATNSTSFSLEVYSLHDAEPLLSFHHSAPSLATSEEGVTEVDSDTVYRLASISKALTMYIYLLAAGDSSFNDPITEYVPELAEYAATHNEIDALNVLDWDSVTVGALASQLSGVPRDPYGGSQLDSVYQQLLGFPPPQVEVSDSFYCGEPPAVVKFPCNRSAFFETNLFRPPIIPSSSSPVYSNLPYQIISYALENITNTSFPDLFQSYLIEAHNLESTFYSVPPNSSGSVIPVNATASFYVEDFLEGSPYGGYYGSTNDLTKVGRAILNSTFLSAAQTRRWLKPVSFLPPSILTDTAGVFQAVGAPWEIIRAPAPAAPITPGQILSSGGSNSSVANVTAAQTYQTWVYTKAGDVGMYSSLIALIPDFDVGFSVMAAGSVPRTIVQQAADYITEAYVPALFEAARLETAQTYAGAYTDASSNSSVVLAIAGPQDANQGLVLQEMIYNGTDLIAALSQWIYGLPEGVQMDAMLYPDGLEEAGSNRSNGDEDIVVEGWRASFRLPGAEGGAGAFSASCWEWAGLGGLGYGGIAFDDFRFTVRRGDGRYAIGLELPALQVNLEKAN